MPVAPRAEDGVDSRYAWMRLAASLALSMLGGVGLWSIVVARHELLRQAGAVVFGLKNLDDVVPPLGARAGSANNDKNAAAGQPGDGAAPPKGP